MCSCMTAAVQHERGPRKPKHHQHHGKDLHHHHHHHHHMGSPPALGGVPVLQAPVDVASSASAKLLFPGAAAPPIKHSTIAAATSGGDHATVPAPPPAAAMFLAHQPPPPGLLQILMSAEKCQVTYLLKNIYSVFAHPFRCVSQVTRLSLRWNLKKPVIFLPFNTDRLFTYDSPRNVVLNKNRSLGNVKSQSFYR